MPLFQRLRNLIREVPLPLWQTNSLEGLQCLVLHEHDAESFRTLVADPVPGDTVKMSEKESATTAMAIQLT